MFSNGRYCHHDATTPLLMDGTLCTLSLDNRLVQSQSFHCQYQIEYHIQLVHSNPKHPPLLRRPIGENKHQKKRKKTKQNSKT
jgi:hypothetical protein